MKIIVVYAVVVFAGFACLGMHSCYAAPIDLPSGLIWPYSDLDGGSIVIENDFVNERSMKEFKGELVANMLSLKLTGSFENKYDLYGIIGYVTGARYKEVDSWALGAVYEYELEDGLLYGFGANAILAPYDEAQAYIFMDFKMRFVDSLEIDTISENGIKYDINSLGVKGVVDFFEIQLALGGAKRINNLLMYGGFKFSDIDIKADYSSWGATLSAELSAKDQFGMFWGFAWAATESVSLDIQARLIDEQAFAAKFSIKL